VVKHNALVKFIEERNRRGQKTIGGILIEKDGSWRFCRNRIQNDSDLTGWEIFNPDLKPTT
jgi:type III restriction enzyme